MRRWFFGASLVLMVLVNFTVSAYAGMDLRPEVHLTLHLDDTQGALTTEIQNILPASWLDNIEELLSDKLDIRTDIRTTQRGGEQYLTFATDFDTLESLESGLTGQFLPEDIPGIGAIPSFFDTFDYEVNRTVLATNYQLDASVSPETTGLLGRLFSVHYHLDMPGIMVENNALRNEEGLPTWVIIPGEELSISARSQVLLGVRSRQWSTLLVPVVGVLGGLGMVILLTAWTIGRVQHRNRRSYANNFYDDDTTYSAHGSWSQMMEDVANVHVQDEYGNYPSSSNPNDSTLDYDR